LNRRECGDIRSTSQGDAVSELDDFSTAGQYGSRRCGKSTVNVDTFTSRSGFPRRAAGRFRKSGQESTRGSEGLSECTAVTEAELAADKGRSSEKFPRSILQGIKPVPIRLHLRHGRSRALTRSIRQRESFRSLRSPKRPSQPIRPPQCGGRASPAMGGCSS
jgi:hypothetical protein